MNLRQHKGYRVALVIAVAAMLAMVMQGCSSSDGSGSMEQDLRDQLAVVQADLENAKADVTRLTGELATANDSLMTANDSLMMANDSLTTALGDVGRLTEELDTANDSLTTSQALVVTLTRELEAAGNNTAEVIRLTGELATANANLGTAQDNVTRLTGELTTAEGRANTLQGQVTTLQEQVRTLTSQVADLRQQLADEVTDPAAHSAARADATVIELAARETPTLGVTQGINAAANVATSRTGKTATIQVTTGAGATAATMIDTTASAGTIKWMSNAESGDEAAGGLARRAVLYTDIEAPTNNPFKDVHGDDDGLIATIMPADIDGGAHTGYAVTVDPDFASGTDTASFVAGAIISGTYDGVDGNYTCIAACVFAKDTEGNIGVTSSGAFTFTPTTNTDTVSVQDTDYVTFGAWLDNPQSLGGTRTIAAFANTGDRFTAANIAVLTGEAEYSGKAAGYYAERFAGQTNAESGNFSATAELTANFDEKADGTAADSTNPGSVSGRIKDFELSSNRSVTWLLVLDAQDATASNGGGATGSAISTTGGGAGGTSWTAGAWGFELVGNDPNFGNLNAEGMAGAYPTGIIGTFGARTGTTTPSDGDDPQPLYLATGAVNPTDVGFVSVVGAFGVRLQDD